MQAFIRCTSTNVNAAVPSLLSFSLRHPPVFLPFLAPAVYCSAVANRKLSGGGRVCADAAPPGWNKTASNESSQRTLRAIRARLERDISTEETPEEAPADPAPRPPKFQKRIDLSDEEVNEASVSTRAVRSRHEVQDLALQSLTGRGRRLPQFLYAVIPDAIAAVEREIQALQAEVDMVKQDMTHRRQHRFSLRYLLDKGRSPEAIARQAECLPPAARRQHFVLSMAYLIHYRQLHRLSAAVMEGFVRSPIPLDPWLIGRSYHMLIAERLAPFDGADGNKARRKQMHKVARECMELLFRILSFADRRRVKIPQIALYLLITKAPISMVADLYWKLKQTGIHIKQFTVFHLTRRLAHLDRDTGVSHWEDALKILDSMQYREEGLCLYPELAKGSFYAVMCQAMRAGAAESTEKILKLMMSVGLEPGVEVYNILMTRASEEHDEAKLRRYFEAITDGGFRPNMVSYSISHAFYKRHRNERMREAVARHAHEIDPKLNLFLATDVLHATVLAEKPYTEVFRRFQMMFRVKMLEDFRISPSLSISRDLSLERRKIEPDSVTLSVMMTSYCRWERAISNIWNLYKLYQEKLHDKSLPNSKLRKMLLSNGSFIPHIIMLGLGKHITGLPYVAAVLEDMLKPDAPIESDVYTWSIFLNFLTRAGRTDEAEAVIQVMRARGIEPNAVTFTTLLSGYVKLNMTENAEEVLGKMKEAGVETTVYTWTSLLQGYVNNGENWRAGDVFRRMLDSNVQPDDVTLLAVSGITDRDRFEAGLAGDRLEDVTERREESAGVVEDDGWFDSDESQCLRP